MLISLLPICFPFFVSFSEIIIYGLLLLFINLVINITYENYRWKFAILCVCLFVCLCVCLFVSLFGCLFIYLFACLFVLFIYLFIYLIDCLFVCLFCLFVCLFVNFVESDTFYSFKVYLISYQRFLRLVVAVISWRISAIK